MSSRSPRVLLARTTLIVLLAALAWPAPRALAQEPPPEVALHLVSQSPWNGPTRPLRLAVEATNTSPGELGSLSLVLSIGFPARSRSVYDLSLSADATSFFFATPFAERGVLAPGQSRTFRIEQALDVLTARAESALYPLKVQLLSGDTPVGTVRTPLIFLIEHPEVPLNVQATWVLWEPVQYGPGGAFHSDAIELDLVQGGRIDQMIEALADGRPLPTNLVVSAALADQLLRMASGYRVIQADGSNREVPKGTGGAADAARLLGLLRRIAAEPTLEVSALPLGDASIPALLHAHLAGDISTMLVRGGDVVHRALGLQPSTLVARPLFSQLNGATLGQLVSHGAQTLVLDTGLVPVPTGLRFSPPPLARLTSGSRSATAIVPDAGAATVAATYRSDPVLEAHAVLGELAAIWLEFPGTPGRGAAVMFPERVSYPPPFFPAFWTLVRRSPWLQPETASQLVATLPEPSRQPLPSVAAPTFDPGYVSRVFVARSALAQFSNVAEQAPSVVSRLHDLVLSAEGSTFIANPELGQEYLDVVRRTIDETYARVGITSSVVTLTSRRGFIPVTIRNGTGFPVHAILRLVADRRLVFPDGATRPVVLRERERTFLIPVRAETTGRFPIKIQLRAPAPGSIPDTIAETDLVVRSTAYNRVALFVTIGAALFLFAWWGRRFLPRRKT